jgi:hypothetical protein
MVTTLAYGLAGGMLIVVATARCRQIAWRFLRLVGMIVLALACGLTLWRWRALRLDPASPMPPTIWLGIALGAATVVIVLIAPLASRGGRGFRIVCALGGMLGLGATSLSALATVSTTHTLSLLGTVMIVASQILGGLLLGSITVSWLLGHAYLTATKMTTAPLRYFSRVLFWVIMLRIVFALLSVLTAWMIGSESAIFKQLEQAWFILLLRVGVGLVGVGVFAYMVTDCVKRRATQSATGILYFGSLFAYIGEMANQQLLLECGWPL